MKEVVTKETIVETIDKIQYVSDDGKIFYTKSSCLKYEKEKLIDAEREKGNIKILDPRNLSVVQKPLEDCDSLFSNCYVYFKNIEALKIFNGYRDLDIYYYDNDKEDGTIYYFYYDDSRCGVRARKIYSKKLYQKKIKELNQYKELAEKF